MNENSRIFVAGHRGLVGSAIVRRLIGGGFRNLLTRTKSELNLVDEHAVNNFFEKEQPEYVFLAAAKVGGILANRDFGADFIFENLSIQNQVLAASHKHGVKKLLFLGSSCIYPKLAPQPIKEEYFLDGRLEETNMPYAVAKIAGIVMCQAFNRQHGTNFISAMPTNLFGPHDNFDLTTSHVLPALIRKMEEARRREESHVTIWGTGKPKRQFLYVDDLADACLFLMQNYDGSEIVNVGTGEDLTIDELARTIRDLIGYQGELVFDESKPDGTPRKVLDVSKINALGWTARTPLRRGVELTIDWARSNCPF